ncbi:MAG TPA: heparan-alpha-glucosaminide N-acetyltransferase domain-containing protein [Caulobacter sp.]|nr:heparan-alpha-glucosaminide N-acetyltransferase domain-containing protein [Caulobacter sp.]
MTEPVTTGGEVAPAKQRLTSIDMLRGAVIILMALDHVRDFFHIKAWTMDPLNPATTDLALYLTRWVTHFCAPTFILLAGVSAFLQGVNGKDTKALSGFLLTRGLWLILLEMTLINFGWNFSVPGIGLIVIWAIGVAMVVLSALVWLPTRAVLGIGIAIIALHNLLDPINGQDLGAWAPLWTILHEPGFLPPFFFVAYPVLPWIGVMALGYGIAPVFQLEPARRARILTVAGLAMIGAFLVLRGFNLYGNPVPWKDHPGVLRDGFSLFNVMKYPPSLDYLLVTLGPVFLLLPHLEKAKGWFADVLLVYGRAPLAFYVLHIFLGHALMMAVGVATGYPAGVFLGFMANPQPLVESGWGFSLWVVYLVWLVVLALLYPVCRWWGELKRRRRDWWLSYL